MNNYLINTERDFYDVLRELLNKDVQIQFSTFNGSFACKAFKELLENNFEKYSSIMEDMGYKIEKLEEMK